MTYNNESLPKLTCSNGVTIPYADISDIQKMIKRIRQGNLFGSSFKYFFVTERGSDRGRPHVHGLIFIPKSQIFSYNDLTTSQLETKVRAVLFKEWRRNYGSDKFPIWKPLFTFRQKFVGGLLCKNFDCHFVAPHTSDKGEDDVAFYVTKYVLKPSDKDRRLQQSLRLNLDPDEYESVWRVVRSRCLCSKGFGAATDLQKQYVRDCIKRSSSNENGFQFYSRDGSISSLARYYRKFVTPEDAVKSVSSRGGPLVYDERPQDLKDKSIANGYRILSEIRNRDLSTLFNDED